MSRWRVVFDEVRAVDVFVYDLRTQTANELRNSIRRESEYCELMVSGFDWMDREIGPHLIVRASLVDNLIPSECPPSSTKLRCRWEYIEYGRGRRILHVQSYSPVGIFDDRMDVEFAESKATIAANSLALIDG